MHRLEETAETCRKVCPYSTASHMAIKSGSSKTQQRMGRRRNRENDTHTTVSLSLNPCSWSYSLIRENLKEKNLHKNSANIQSTLFFWWPLFSHLSVPNSAYSAAIAVAFAEKCQPELALRTCPGVAFTFAWQSIRHSSTGDHWSLLWVCGCRRYTHCNG